MNNVNCLHNVINHAVRCLLGTIDFATHNDICIHDYVYKGGSYGFMWSTNFFSATAVNGVLCGVHGFQSVSKYLISTQ